MNKIIFMTDTHFRSKAPIYRKDDILKNSLEQFKWVLEYAKDRNAVIIHGGDLFHFASPSDAVANSVAELIHNVGVKVYYIIGNHDCIGGNRDSCFAAKVGLFRYFKNFVLLGSRPIELEDCILCGYDYSKSNEVPELIDPLKDFDLTKKNKSIICVVHAMIATEQEITVSGKRKLINPNSIHSTADLILCGHYHPGFTDTNKLFKNDFVNPGAFARLEYRDAERKPMIAEITVIGRNISYELVVIPHANDIFDIDKAALDKMKKNDRIRFLDALENMKEGDLAVENVLTLLDQLQISEDVSTEIKEVLSDKVVGMCKEKLLKILEE